VRIFIQAVVLSLCGFAHAADTYPAQIDGLKLEVVARLSDSQAYTTPDQTTKGGWRWGGSFLLVEVALRNVGERPIKLPTQSYFQLKRHSLEHWGPREFLLIRIEPPVFDGKPTTFAETRFHPVELAPGEAVLIERFHEMTEDVAVAKRLTSVIVRYVVSARFSERLSWWHGAIGVEQTIERTWTDVPPSDPLRMPTRSDKKEAR
jgi:hypothetical protein